MRRRFDRGITLLILANLTLVAVLATALLVDLVSSDVAGHPAQAETVVAASPDLMPMGLAHIPTSSSCLLCHETGGDAGLKPVPAIGHPLDGWRECSACHNDERLGKTATGHAGIPQAECVNCHKVAQPGPAITQPHSRLQDQLCLDCHGSYAHLPTSMVGRRQDECWLCHKPDPLPPPEYPHPGDSRLACRTCHQSTEIGNMPIDHALRNDETCLLCHDIKVASQGPAASPGPEASPQPGG
jgi:hypothetical protein